SAEMEQAATGAPVLGAGAAGAPVVGAVTSSCVSPMLGDAPIAFAMVRWANAAVGMTDWVRTVTGVVPAVVQESLRFWKTDSSEERFRVALAGAPITVFNQDRELRYTWMNNPQWAMHSRDVLGKRDEDLFAPETARRLTELKRRVLESGVGEHAEVAITGLDGTVRFFDFRAEPLRDPSGRITGITGVKVDISDRKRADQHKAFLLAELDHRVKNNLSVVLALAEESMRASGSMADFSRSFIGRV